MLLKIILTYSFYFLVKEETENPALEVDSIQTFEEWKKNQINEEKVSFFI